MYTNDARSTHAVSQDLPHCARPLYVGTVRLLAIAASALAILLAIGLATHARSGAPAGQAISNSTTDQMTGRSAADALLSGANVELIRTPQRKPSESGSVATCLIAQAPPAPLISSALATERFGSWASLVRFLRLQI
jgi:hypothetical protein